MAEGMYLIDIINVKKATKILIRRDIRILSQITGNNIYMNQNTTEDISPNFRRAKVKTKNLYCFYRGSKRKSNSLQKSINKQRKGKKKKKKLITSPPNKLLTYEAQGFSSCFIEDSGEELMQSNPQSLPNVLLISVNILVPLQKNKC